jgi:hypothetical protein
VSGQALDVAIGLVLAFLIVSLVASAVVEGVSMLLKKRSKDLESVIAAIMSDPRGAEQTLDLYATSVFTTFEAAAQRKRGPGAAADTRKPSYVSARSFADAVIEGLAQAKSTAGAVDDQVTAVLAQLPDGSPIKTRLVALISEANGDLRGVKAGLETWFDDTMDRLAGSYKRWSKWMLLVVGIVIAVVLNVSALRIVATLWNDAPVRSAVADAASVYAGQHPDDPNSLHGVQDAISALDTLKLPVGWSQGWGQAGPLGDIAGMLVTGLAVMLGAPFWFDLLTKLLTLRTGTSVPPKAVNDPASATTRLTPGDVPAPAVVDARIAVSNFVRSLPALTVNLAASLPPPAGGRASGSP